MQVIIYISSTMSEHNNVIVIPVFNNAACLEWTFTELEKIIASELVRAIIFVDDRGKNNAHTELYKKFKSDAFWKKIQVIEQVENQGKWWATTSGMVTSIGMKSEYTIVLNDDIRFMPDTLLENALKYTSSQDLDMTIMPDIESPYSIKNVLQKYERGSISPLHASWNRERIIKTPLLKQILANKEVYNILKSSWFGFEVILDKLIPNQKEYPSKKGQEVIITQIPYINSNYERQSFQRYSTSTALNKLDLSWILPVTK